MNEHIIQPIDIEESISYKERLFGLYSLKINELKEYLSEKDKDNAWFQYAFDFVILSAKVSQKSEYPIYPPMGEEIISLLNDYFEYLMTQEPSSQLMYDMYITKLRIEQKTLFHTFPAKNEDYAKYLRLSVMELNDIINNPKLPRLEKSKARYDRELEKMWLDDYVMFQNVKKEDIKKSKDTYLNKISQYKKLNEIISSYIYDLKNSCKSYDIQDQRNMILAIRLKYDIEDNKRTCSLFKRIIDGTDNSAPPAVKILKEDAYKYFTDHIKEFEIVIAAKQRIIKGLELLIQKGLYKNNIEKADYEIECCILANEINAHKRYIHFFEQRINIVP